MNRIPLPKSRPARRPRSQPNAAQVELTLQLPRGDEGSQPKRAVEAEEAPRGIAEIDFYIS